MAAESWFPRVREIGDPLHTRRQFKQDFECLLAGLGGQTRDPCDVAARVRKGRNQASGDRVSGGEEDDGDDRCRANGCTRRGRAGARDQIRLQGSQLGCKCRQTLDRAIRMARLEEHALSLDVSELAQAIAERRPGFLESGRADFVQQRDAIGPSCGLRDGGARSGEDDQGHGQRTASFHSQGTPSNPPGYRGTGSYTCFKMGP